MATLRRSDLESVLDFAAYVAELDPDDPYTPEVLFRVQELVPSYAVTYEEVDIESHRDRAHVEVGPPADVDPALYRLYGPCPIEVYRARTGESGALRLSDVMARHAWHEHPLYREYFKPGDVDCILDLGLPSDPGRARSLTLFREDGDRDFSERDVEVLERLRPHLRRLDPYGAFRRHVAELRPDGIGTSRRLDGAKLTPREREIAELVAEGKTNAEIAASLWIAPGTVKKHLENIYAKIGVGRRAAVAAAATSTRL
jgi:DNA-binding CsgD family transcriptional regulator